MCPHVLALPVGARLIVGGRDKIGMDPDLVKVMAHRPNDLVADFKAVV